MTADLMHNLLSVRLILILIFIQNVCSSVTASPSPSPSPMRKRLGRILSSTSVGTSTSLSDDDAAWGWLRRGEKTIEKILTDYKLLQDHADILVRNSYWPLIQGMDFSHEANEELRNLLQTAAEKYATSVSLLSTAPGALDTLSLEAQRYHGLVSTKNLRDRLSTIISNARRTARELELLPHDMPPIGGQHILQSPELIRLARAWLRQKHANIIFKARGSLFDTRMLLAGDEEEPGPTDAKPLDAPDVWKHRYQARKQEFASHVGNRSFRDRASPSVYFSPTHGQTSHQEEPVTSDPHAPWQRYHSSPDNYEYIGHFSDAFNNLHHR